MVRGAMILAGIIEAALGSGASLAGSFCVSSRFSPPLCRWLAWKLGAGDEGDWADRYCHIGVRNYCGELQPFCLSSFCRRETDVFTALCSPVGSAITARARDIKVASVGGWGIVRRYIFGTSRPESIAVQARELAKGEGPRQLRFHTSDNYGLVSFRVNPAHGACSSAVKHMACAPRGWEIRFDGMFKLPDPEAFSRQQWYLLKEDTKCFEEDQARKS
jgi:hypothetical protein